MNRWELTSEVRKKYTPMVEDFIHKLETMDAETATDLLEQDFSNTELNPHTLNTILEELGYEETDNSNNGWQLDYWITMSKDGCKSIVVNGTGIIFELKLTEKD